MNGTSSKKDAYEKDEWQMVHLPQIKMYKKKMGVWWMVHLPERKDVYERIPMVHLPEKKRWGFEKNGWMDSALKKRFIWKNGNGTSSKKKRQGLDKWYICLKKNW